MLSTDAQAMAEAIRDGDLQGLSAAQLKDLYMDFRTIDLSLDCPMHRVCQLESERSGHNPAESRQVRHAARSLPRYAAGVTKSSRMRNAADDPVSTRASSVERTASRRAASRFSSSGRP